MKTVVIGAGFAGLSAACYLARDGHEVVVLEKNAAVGGRARQFEHAGFRFDMGPTFYWMPDLFERFFADFGRKPSDYYTLRKLDPAYEIRFGPDDRLVVPAGPAAVESLFERIEPGSGAFLRKYLRQAEFNYRVAVDRVIDKPGRSPLELVMPQTVVRLPQFFRSLSGVVRRGVRDERLRRMLEFPSLFLGAKPERTPSFYRFMNHADIALGSWHVEGGMVQVAAGMRRLAESLGAEFRTGRPARRIAVDGDRVRGVDTDRGFVAADVVVSAADYHHTERLLPARCRNYTESYWYDKVFAPSAVLFYIAFGRRIGGVAHHTLFFDAPFDEHAARIYDSPGWPERPLFYASFPSVTDPTLCPAGCETAIVLIPAAAGLKDTPEVRERYFAQAIERMEQLTGERLREYVLFSRSYAARDFIRDYNACEGNAYGLANILSQTAFLRPKVCNRHLPDLFYAGQLTVPGPGVPPALVSGKVAARLASERLKKRQKNTSFRYGPTLR